MSAIPCWRASRGDGCAWVHQPDAISGEQGMFLQSLLRLWRKARHRSGYITGYSSSVSLAGCRPMGGSSASMPPRMGRISPENWSKAGVRERIELRLGSAIPV